MHLSSKIFSYLRALLYLFKSFLFNPILNLKKILNLYRLYKEHGLVAATNLIRSRLIFMSKIRVSYKKKLDFEKKFAFRDFKPLPPEAITCYHKISIILPVYNPPLKFLKKAIQSVLNQTYPHWELCIVDDASSDPRIPQYLKKVAREDSRVKVHFNQKNLNISKASNQALNMCSGSYFARLDHDDELHPTAIETVVNYLLFYPNALFLYSDHDYINSRGIRFDPYFKPDFNFELLLGQNYVTHLDVYHTQKAKDLKGFREGFEGSQDHDFALRFTENLKEEEIVHIPRVLYHWRILKGSIAGGIKEKAYTQKSSLKVIESYIQRNKLSAKVLPLKQAPTYHRIQHLLAQTPLVSIIIPTKDNIKYLKPCIESIVQNTTYHPYEILVVDNQSEKEETFHYYNKAQSYFKLLHYPHPFNFSAINNFAAQKAQGEVLVFLNDDTKIISPDWLTELTSQALRPQIGAVGCTLLYKNNTIQHAGIILGINGSAGHIHRGQKAHQPGYFGKLHLSQYVMAVTGACLAVEKSKFLEVQGFDEKNLKVAFNDVDFCLKLYQKGYRNLFTPFVKLYHYESISRGSDAIGTQRRRHDKELKYLKTKWRHYFEHDPYFNPNLSLNSENFKLSLLSREFLVPHKILTKAWRKKSPCRICKDSSEKVHFFAKEQMFDLKENFSYFICPSCKTLQIESPPKNMDKYYPKHAYYSFQEKQKPWYIEFAEKQRNHYVLNKKGVFGKWVNQRAPYLPLSSLQVISVKKEHRILDVGCGEGLLLKYLHQNGYKHLCGIDPYIEEEQIFSENYQILKKDLSEMNGQWDLIMFHHSLEHLEDQQQELLKAKKLLAPEGKILIRVPLFSSFAWNRFQENWVQLDAPRHFYLNSKEGLYLLANQTGLQVEKIVYDSSEFQFWGSEQYQKGISLYHKKSLYHKGLKRLLGLGTLSQYKHLASEVNQYELGDQGIFVLA